MAAAGSWFFFGCVWREDGTARGRTPPTPEPPSVIMAMTALVLRGRGQLVRYADDFVMVFEREDDARRVYGVLGQRFERYGLKLHLDKTKLLDCRKPKGGQGGPGPGPGTFDLLGFTHYWGRSRRGKWVMMKQTAKGRFSRALRRIAEWCREHRHDPMGQQDHTLGQKLRGHYAYYGVTFNWRALSRFYRAVIGTWRKWLSRRSSAAYKTWTWMNSLLKRLPPPRPRIVHGLDQPRLSTQRGHRIT